MKSFLLEHMSLISDALAGTLLVTLVFAPLLFCAARRRTYVRTWFITWMGYSAWGVLMCALLPLAAYRITGDRTVWRHFPDGPGAVACFLAGWLPAAILTVVVKSIFEFFYSRRNKSAAKEKTVDA